ncbi:MAG: YwaF family protein [Oscillospiraceae bacterium]|nr:YwaF family protein [Oscillospiraceae bacterium]
MKWGSFGSVHIATLILAALILLLTYQLLKNKSQKTQILVLFLLSLTGNASTIYNLVLWGEPLDYLPLHLCAINALLLPFAVLSREKRVCNLLLLWSLGALVALVANGVMADVDIFSDVFFFYYMPHVFEFGIPLLLFRLGLVEKDPKCIKTTLGYTWLAYTGVYGINKLINFLCAALEVTRQDGSLVQVNYMYSMGPIDPLSGALWNILPCEYWYMLLALPIIAVYLVALYAPQMITEKKRQLDSLPVFFGKK